MAAKLEGHASGMHVVRPHSEGFDRALDDALHKLDGTKYPNQKFQVLFFVTITPNPGGVGQYSVELNPVGGGGGG